jgi:hypothetical protein
VDGDLREAQMRRLRRAMAMATAGELHRAADFLEFAAKVRRGKRRGRAASRRSNAAWTTAPKPRS